MQLSASDKAACLLLLIYNGLRTHAKQASARTLGDRSQYIGLSDIGRALECPRAALASKLFPCPQFNLQKQLTLQRGHWLEHGIGQALAVHGLHMLPQLELGFVHNGVPIKAHLDFALAWEKPRPAVRILEIKSTGQLPEVLFTSYETQLYGQAGFLAQLWNEPAFSLRDGNGTLLHANLTMPQLCKAHFGLAMPKKSGSVDIEAWVLCISMSDAKAFGPYAPDASMRELCLHTAESLWQNKLAVDNGQIDINAVPHATGFHALCASCDWNRDCPKFHDGEYQPEWQPELERLENLKEARGTLDKEIEEMENGLKDAYALSGMAGNWINTGSHRFRVTPQNGRKSLNRDRLHQELTIALGESKADDLLARCEQEGRPFPRFVVNAIN
ncbi:MAG: hypothetical protein FWH34_06185 [Desulfovibrionaceae bacterium]|nr:hypothetical protein [Desulfovibrionaceae bacterium]